MKLNKFDEVSLITVLVINRLQRYAGTGVQIITPGVQNENGLATSSCPLLFVHGSVWTRIHVSK